MTLSKNILRKMFIYFKKIILLLKNLAFISSQLRFFCYIHIMVFAPQHPQKLCHPQLVLVESTWNGCFCFHVPFFHVLPRMSFSQ